MTLEEIISKYRQELSETRDHADAVCEDWREREVVVKAGDLAVLLDEAEDAVAMARSMVPASIRNILLDRLRDIKRFGELACVDASGPGYVGGKKPATKDVWQIPRHMLPDIDDAITRATGDQS